MRINYGKYNLTSRLEARWAVFFDTYKWNWEYIKCWDQPSHFILHDVRIVYKDGSKPDLYGQDVYIEAMNTYDQYVFMKASIIRSCGNFALIVGEIPYGNSDSQILSRLKKMITIKNHNDGHYRYREYDFYTPENYSFPIGTSQSLLWADDNFLPVIGTWHTKSGRNDGNISNTLEAYKHARQARFEYGESGYTDLASNYY